MWLVSGQSLEACTLVVFHIGNRMLLTYIVSAIEVLVCGQRSRSSGYPPAVYGVRYTSVLVTEKVLAKEWRRSSEWRINAGYALYHEQR